MVPLGQALIADSMAGTSSTVDEPPAWGVHVDALGPSRTRSGIGAGIGSAAAKHARYAMTQDATKSLANIVDKLQNTRLWRRKRRHHVDISHDYISSQANCPYNPLLSKVPLFSYIGGILNPGAQVATH
jgi:hypothetical protein